MPLHLVTPIDRAQDTRADSDSLELPDKGWRSHAADLCYIVLRGSTFLASSYLMALGLPLLFFLLISGGDAGVFFAHLANLAVRFGEAEPARQVIFVRQLAVVTIILFLGVSAARYRSLAAVFSAASAARKD